MDRSAFLLDLREWGILTITGPDAREFLQGVGTQEVASFRNDAALPTFFLTEKGRPVALAWGTPRPDGDGYTLFVEAGGRDAMAPHLDRLRVMEDVAFEESGPAHGARLYGVAGHDRDRMAHEWTRGVAGSHVIAADPITFILLSSADTGESGKSLAVAAVSAEEAEAWRIAAGVPRAGVDFDLDRIATELSCPEAIATTKGCFVGQEVVARTTHRGAVRRRRVGFRYPGEAGLIPRGTELRAGGKAVGFVTSTTLEATTGRGLGMGYLSTEAPDGPGDVQAIHNTGTPLEIAPWPL